jgi:glycosyltransferase involved in cell wall biosynthesis
LDSVLSQTYDNIECIIVDDGSTDQTKWICEAYVQKDPRVQYIYQDNKGVSAARNKGFEMSKGEFIHFLDGDDFIAVDKIEQQLNHLMAQPDLDISYSNYCHYFQDKKLYQEAQHKIVAMHPLENFLFSWDRDVGTTIHSALFRRNIWHQNEKPFPDDYHSRYEDWVFWVLVALKNKTIGHLNFTGAYYRIHNHNLTSDTKRNIQYFFQAMFYLHDKIPANYRKRFVEENVNFVLEKYAKHRIFVDVYHTWTWKLAKLFSFFLKPFNGLIRHKSS